MIASGNQIRAARGALGWSQEAGFQIEDVPAPLPVTVSIGRAFHRPDEAGCALVNRADAALYASKNRGRNMVTLAAAA